VIDTRAEREKFLEAMKLAWRASETLPSLTQMIDTNQSSELMARTLWDAAKLLRHRSELVAILEKICGHDTTLLPDSSHAAKHLSVQRELTRKSISAIDADIANLLSHLESAATAGESFIQERKIKRAASQIEEELLSVGLYISDTNTTSSEQLAIDTKNVLDAYRELNELYGNLQ
jgi:cob(I)alamin adenosyltransferase